MIYSIIYLQLPDLMYYMAKNGKTKVNILKNVLTFQVLKYIIYVVQDLTIMSIKLQRKEVTK